MIESFVGAESPDVTDTVGREPESLNVEIPGPIDGHAIWPPNRGGESPDVPQDGVVVRSKLTDSPGWSLFVPPTGSSFTHG